jgi:hypothetical protein
MKYNAANEGYYVKENFVIYADNIAYWNGEMVGHVAEIRKK